jgi:3'-phosphoadenosine 5'-phosphosulfate sulfotransferase
MISRCEYEKFKGWKNYGGRGIKVATAWRDSFEKFYADVGPRPTPKHSLDRIDVNGDYTPGNVRWADGKTQCRNTRVNKLVQFRGQKVPLITAVETLGLKYNTVLYRLRRGKSVEEALR